MPNDYETPAGRVSGSSSLARRFPRPCSYRGRCSAGLVRWLATPVGLLVFGNDVVPPVVIRKR